jgi:hypothetical protein
MASDGRRFFAEPIIFSPCLARLARLLLLTYLVEKETSTKVKNDFQNQITKSKKFFLKL